MGIFNFKCHGKKAILAFLVFTNGVISKSQTDDTKAIAPQKCENQIKQLIKETDSDPIIKGQESNSKWAENLLVKPDVYKPNVDVVSYYYNELGDGQKYHKATVTIKLATIKAKGISKINTIL